MFRTWLLAQRARQDDVGGLALLAAADRRFPKQSELHRVLRWCGDNAMLRRAAKHAHAEFRRERDAAKAVGSNDPVYDGGHGSNE